MSIEIIQGNLFNTDASFICHQVNCQGVMGSGVAKQVKELYPSVYELYKKQVDEFKITSRDKLLGISQFVTIGKNKKCIINMFAQKNFGRQKGVVYTNYEAFEECLDEIVEQMSRLKMLDGAFDNFDIAFPYNIGCDRGGGDWEKVYSLIQNKLKDFNVKIYKL